MAVQNRVSGQKGKTGILHCVQDDDVEVDGVTGEMAEVQRYLSLLCRLLRLERGLG